VTDGLAGLGVEIDSRLVYHVDMGRANVARQGSGSQRPELLRGRVGRPCGKEVVL